MTLLIYYDLSDVSRHSNECEVPVGQRGVDVTLRTDLLQCHYMVHLGAVFTCKLSTMLSMGYPLCELIIYLFQRTSLASNGRGMNELEPSSRPDAPLMAWVERQMPQGCLT